MSILDKYRVWNSRDIMTNFVDFVRDSPKLQHLDISCMRLGEKLYEICQGISESKSLLSAHIGDNYIDEETLEKILLLFGIDKPSMGTTLTNGFGLMDSIDQMEYGTDLHNIVNEMYIDQDEVYTLAK